jgi:hypothetical protein
VCYWQQCGQLLHTSLLQVWYQPPSRRSWSSCSAGSVEFANGTCGFIPLFEPYTCNFSACSEQDPWHPNGSAFQRWQGIAEETPVPSQAPAVAPFTPAPTLPVSVPAAPQLPMSPSGEASSAAGLPTAHVSFAVVVTTCAMLCGLLCANFLSHNWFHWKPQLTVTIHITRE